MAVSAVYCTVSRVPIQRGDVDETVRFSNISATTALFTLIGGTYGMSVVGTSFGSVTLQILGPDGTTLLTAATAVVANGFASVNLPPGSYKLALA